MRIISRRRLREFWEAHREAEKPLRQWYALVAAADWQEPSDVKSLFSSVDFVTGPHRTLAIFNIGGNRFRLTASIHYNTSRIYIRHVMTHDVYDTGRWKGDL